LLLPSGIVAFIVHDGGSGLFRDKPLVAAATLLRSECE
jgi:hypothetical protein